MGFVCVDAISNRPLSFAFCTERDAIALLLPLKIDVNVGHDKSCPYPNATLATMKAHEVLKRYAAGRRDFSGENLRGQSFKGKNLSGVNFSEADIRGANFTNAKLTGANFAGAKAGLQRRWATGLVIGLWIISGLSGIYALFFGAVIAHMADNAPIQLIIPSCVALMVFTASFFANIRKGLVLGLRTFAGAFTIVGAFARSLAFTFAFAFALTGTIAIIFAVLGAFAGAVTGTPTVAIAAAIVGSVTVVSSYIGWRALAGDEQYDLFRSFAIAFATLGGTSFRNADLTNADFTSATLNSTDFRNATLTCTNLHQTKKLDLARVGKTILIDTKVRDLVVTHRGAKQSYIGCNLKGANLVGADLNDADFTEADISGANLQGAWLERANLTKTQALNTNFHKANLTGACIEAWNIDSTTQLDDASCDYIYLLNNHQERRPNSGEFAPGEFTKLFEEVLNTVDLIFRNGIDWKAFVLSFNAIQAQNEGTELSLQSIENKGDGVVIARLNVSEDADKEKIHSDFMQIYELKLKAVEETYKAKLNAKDNEIEIYRQKSSEMKEIVSLLASRPINVDVKATADSKSIAFLILVRYNAFQVHQF